MQLGVNVDPRHGPSTLRQAQGSGHSFRAADIAAPGVTWVRTVLTPGYDMGPWLHDCHTHGLKVLGVIARESFRRSWTYKSAAHYYRFRYGHPTNDVVLDAWQIGNEPDLRSPSSWTMRPERLNRLLRAFRAAIPDATIIGPGLASGQPGYLNGVDLRRVSAVAIHPYGQRPSPNFPTATWGFGEVRTLLGLYRQALQPPAPTTFRTPNSALPIWITEFGGPDRDFEDESQRARYHSEMLLAMRDAGVEVAMVFCWSDAMVQGFGLLDTQGNAKESYASFFDGARAVVSHELRGVHNSPLIIEAPGVAAGRFTLPPRGVILHATRSGHTDANEEAEFWRTVRYVNAGAGGLGWHVTVGPDLLAVHLTPDQWGWNAREHSRYYLAIEFAQAQPGHPISDASLDTAAWWLNNIAKATWPELPSIIHHSELPAGIRDGKTDVYPRNTWQADHFRARLANAVLAPR